MENVATATELLQMKLQLLIAKILCMIKEFRCYEAKIEESEKTGSCWESNPEHLWLEPSVLCH